MKKIFVYFVFMLLAACSWRSPQSKFYMMDSTGLQPVSQRKTNVSVARVKVPDILDKAQIVVSNKDNAQQQVRELQILEFHRWAEVFPDVLQNTVTNDLIAYLPSAYVERSYFDNNKSGYTINIEVNNLQAYENDKVILDVWWNIKNTSGNIVRQKQSRYETAVSGKGVEALVDAESNAVHLMSKDIAETLMNL